MSSINRRQFNVLGLAVPAASLIGSSLGALAMSTAASAASSRGGAIGLTEILARARNWDARDVQYSQESKTTDIDGDHEYRKDCSGFVSMAWHASDNSFWTGSNWSSIATAISKDNMRPGDALITASRGHAVLFYRWVDKGAGTFKFIHMSNPRTDVIYGTGDTGGNISSHPGSSYTAYRYDKSFDDTVAPDPDWNMHALVNEVGGELEHRYRRTNGTWTDRWGDVEGQAGELGAIRLIASAGMYADLHTLAVSGAGTLMHSIRDGSDGTWSAFHSVENQTGNLPNITSIAAASTGKQLEVLAVADGKLMHTIRYADGSWQDFWGNVENQAGTLPGPITKVAATRVGSALHIAVVAGGYVRHAVRASNGSWGNWGNIENRAGEIGTVTDVTLAGTGAQAQVIALTNGKLHHTIRYADGTWQAFKTLSAFSSVTPISISAANVDGEMHFAVVTSAGSMKHTIRKSTGSWQDVKTISSTGIIASPRQITLTGSL